MRVWRERVCDGKCDAGVCRMGDQQGMRGVGMRRYLGRELWFGCGRVLQVKVYRNKVMLTGVYRREDDRGGTVWGWCGDRCLGRGRRQAWRVTAIKLCQLVRVSGRICGRMVWGDVWVGAEEV